MKTQGMISNSISGDAESLEQLGMTMAEISSIEAVDHVPTNESRPNENNVEAVDKNQSKVDYVFQSTQNAADFSQKRAALCKYAAPATDYRTSLHQLKREMNAFEVNWYLN